MAKHCIEPAIPLWDLDYGQKDDLSLIKHCTVCFPF